MKTRTEAKGSSGNVHPRRLLRHRELSRALKTHGLAHRVLWVKLEYRFYPFWYRDSSHQPRVACGSLQNSLGSVGSSRLSNRVPCGKLFYLQVRIYES
jgi:hypothetical protein